TRARASRATPRAPAPRPAITRPRLTMTLWMQRSWRRVARATEPGSHGTERRLRDGCSQMGPVPGPAGYPERDEPAVRPHLRSGRIGGGRDPGDLGAAAGRLRGPGPLRHHRGTRRDDRG